MTIAKTSGVGAATLASFSEAPEKSFGQIMKGAVEGPLTIQKPIGCPPGGAPVQGTVPSAPSGSVGPASQNSVQQVAESVSAAQRRLEGVLALAQSGKTFTPAELIALQGQVYRASQELDLAGKVIEKATSGVKQVLQTQV